MQQAKESEENVDGNDDEISILTEDFTPSGSPQKTHHYWSNLAKTLLFCYTFIMLGIVVSALGPSLLELSSRVNSTVSRMGVVFTLRGIGYVCSALTVGYILDKFSLYSDNCVITEGNSNVIVRYLFKHMEKSIMLLGIFLMVVGMVLTPLANRLWMLVIINFCIGIGSGCIDSPANILLMWLWKDEVNPYMQSLHFSFGLGAFVCPLYLQLVHWIFEKTKWTWMNWLTVAYAGLAIFTATAAIFFFFVSFDKTDNEGKPAMPDDTEKLMDSDTLELPDLVLTAPSEHPNIMIDPPIEEGNNQAQGWRSQLNALNWKAIYVTLLCGVALLFYVGAEVAYGSLIYSYVLLNTNDFTERTASLITSTFWLSFTIGRLISIPLSKYLTIRSMLIIDLVVTTAFVLVLVFINNYVFLWIATVCIGLAQASQFPSTLSLPGTHLNMKVTGLMTSSMVVCGAFGEMLVPIFMTIFLKQFMVILLIVCSISGVLYGILLFVVKKEPAVDDLSTAAD